MNSKYERRLKLGIFLCGMALVTLGGGLCARPVTRYLYLDHWAYRYIDLLQDRGYLRELSRSIRPYTRGEVAEAIARLAGGRKKLGGVEGGWVELLEREFAGDIRLLRSDGGGGPAYYLRGVGREDAVLQRNRGDADYFFSGEGVIRYPALVFSTRFSVDQGLFDDPYYLGRKDISLAGRIEDSYLLAGGRWITLFIGRTERNWSPFPGTSLFLSRNPFSYDHLFLRLGGRRLALRSMFARLSDLPSGYGGESGVQRYLSAHRIDFRLGGWLQMGIFESALYGRQGAGIDLALLNPFSPYIVIENATSREMNSFVGFDAYFTPSSRWTASVQLLVDDVKLSIFGRPIFYGKEVEPNEFGMALGATWADPFGLSHSNLHVRYVKVTNYTYNAPDSLERYLQAGKGLGAAPGNDFDELSEGIEFFPLNSWIFDVSSAYRRKGEGRVTDPFPAEFSSSHIPFPSGVVEKNLSLSAGARFQPSDRWFVRGRLGFESIKNRDHLVGEDHVEMEGELRIQASWGRWFPPR